MPFQKDIKTENKQYFGENWNQCKKEIKLFQNLTH